MCATISRALCSLQMIRKFNLCKITGCIIVIKHVTALAHTWRQQSACFPSRLLLCRATLLWRYSEPDLNPKEGYMLMVIWEPSVALETWTRRYACAQRDAAITGEHLHVLLFKLAVRTVQ